MFRPICTFLAAPILVALPNLALAQDSAGAGPTLVQGALPAVVTLRAYDTDGTEIRLGSGFILEDERVATNSHVVAGAAWVEIFDQHGDLLGTAPYAEIVSTRLDLVILPKIAGSKPGLRLSALKPQTGEEVWVIGSPEGLIASTTKATVSPGKASISTG